MANIKISELPTASEFNDDDYTVIVQSNNTKKITKKNMYKNYIYSTDETEIGKWINGKPIYRKVIDTGDLTDMTRYTEYNSITIQTGISEIDQVTNIKWIGKNTNEKTFTDILSYKWITSEPAQTIMNSLCWYALFINYETYLNDTVLYIQSNGVDRINWIDTSYAIIEYTKTTD